MSEDLKNMKRKVRSLERKYKAIKKPEVKQELKILRSKYKKLLCNTKRKYINEKFIKCGTNTKMLCKTLNQIIGKDTEVILPPEKDTEFASNLLQFFMDKIKKIKVNLDNYELFTPPSNSSHHKLEVFKEISTEEVKKIIMESKPTTCRSGPLPSTVVKHHLNILLPVITRIINWSLRTISFDKFGEGQSLSLSKTCRKRHKVHQLQACEQPALLKQNYWEGHDSTTSSISRNILRTTRYSMWIQKKNLSTEHTILKLLDTICKNMDKQCVTLVTAIDLSATFDMVNSSLLLQVLNQTYCVKGTALKWFDSYLSNLSVCVQINNSVSQELDLPFSVPQGSSAGLILFNIYISTLTRFLGSSNCDLLGYADDNTISACIDTNVQNDKQQVIGNIQNSLEKSQHWMHLNRLKMNNQKTKFIM